MGDDVGDDPTSSGGQSSGQSSGHSHDRLPPRRRDLIARPRLLDVVAARFDRPLTVITGGAGFGKSTLLAQAVHDPVTRARGRDVFHRCSERDRDPTSLIAALAGAFGVSVGPDDDLDATVERVAAAIWHDAPRHLAIVIDDTHLIEADSPSWTLLEQLLGALPSNGHLVLSGRMSPAIKLSRRLAAGDAVEVTESMLTFTSDELDQFAQLRSVDRATLAEHGWPALTELVAHSGVVGAHRFVSEEVLSDIDDDRLHALRQVAVHHSIDDELVAAVTDFEGTADELVDGLPLTSASDDGTTVTLHDLWRDLLVGGLTPDERRVALSTIAGVVVSRGQLREACEIAIEVGDAALVSRVLLDFARDIQLSSTVADRTAVLDLLADDLSSTPEALLVRADTIFATDPTRAGTQLRRAIAAAHESGRGEVEVLAHVRLGELAYRSGDLDGLGASIDSLSALQRGDTVGATAAHALLDVWRHLLDNGAEKALTLIGSDDLVSYPPVGALVDYYRAVLLGFSGHCSSSLAAVEDLRGTPNGRILGRMGGFASIMRWYSGTLSAHDRAETMRLLAAIGGDRQVHLFVEGASTAALFAASAGDLVGARQILADVYAHRDRIGASTWGAITAELATAVVELLDGDEQMAAARIEEVLPDTGPFVGFGRHVFGNVGAAVYALVPRSRQHFDAEDTGPDLAVGTAVGRALVAVRERGQYDAAARLPWHELDRIRTWAYEPHLVELALAAIAGGAAHATAAFDTVQTDARQLLAAIAERYDGRMSELASERLATTPTRPSTTLHISVLGSLRVRRDDHDLDDSGPLRRKMVRELLMLLVHRRRVRRAEAVDLLWPDKDESAGANNLRVTLTHLRALLDESADDAPPWHLRVDGEHLVLHDSDLLRIDAEDFARHIADGAAADRRREPDAALAHLRAACDLCAGDYLADASDPDWAYHHRVGVHLDLVEAATRCAELLAAHGEAGEAIRYARRAVEAEPLSERAQRALTRALLAHGDRAGAARTHRQLLELLAAEGLAPEHETVRLTAEL